jgi:tRNA(adenine34) deaminase
MGQDNLNNETDDIRFMDIAIGLARDAQQKGEVPVGAVVVFEGRVIGGGHNSSIATNDVTTHAEINALREASAAQGNYRLAGCTLYGTLEPCLMCAGAMIHARIHRLVYACTDPKSGAAGSLYNVPADPRLNHQIEVISGISEAESRQLLRSFFEQRRENTRP